MSEPKAGEGGLRPYRRAAAQRRISELEEGEEEILTGAGWHEMLKLNEGRRAVAQGPGGTE